MKISAVLLFIMAAILVLASCNQSNQKEQDLQNEIDNLKEIINTMHKPGFGDFMGSIQNHHDKLWFAGINENWELASFEIHELEELFEDIKTVHPNREETQSLPMIDPGLKAVEKAVKEQNKEEFKKGYTLMTNACNTCHQATKHEFIRIKTPVMPSYSNQNFEIPDNE